MKPENCTQIQVVDRMPKTCAFIFARGGSKGLPRKNILPIAGIPMLVYGLNIAKALEQVDKIYVSTDCEGIAKVAETGGAVVIERPNELASDSASEWLSWKHAIKAVQTKGEEFDTFLSLPPTAPLRNIQDVENCLNALRPEIDIVITMTPARRSPWFNMVTKDSRGKLKLAAGAGKIFRRQDAPVCFDITTVAYVAKTNFILSADSIWDGNVAGVEIPEERALDIDTPLDFEIAKFLIEKKNLNA